VRRRTERRKEGWKEVRQGRDIVLEDDGGGWMGDSRDLPCLLGVEPATPNLPLALRSWT